LLQLLLQAYNKQFKKSREIFIQTKINKELALSVSCLHSTGSKPQAVCVSAVCPLLITVLIVINTERAVNGVSPDFVP
jgi:hypothetical protein